ncbi:MAG: [FeFe] hydrogenase H-cluster maturation GTPase HydF [Provencibacterium sp.]|jgi:[FeFe] hydrogenase H-cluster maturation GTPase HydF|nr:[FeFe] hydrogenase H-cluster maturation GTPase HydF [Provencibacterium sp.]
MGLNDTPGAERVHIGFFGRRNAGKSSLVNAVAGQELSVVSEVKGTTTDPVFKSMELLPLGPIVLMDTPGFDDEGELGEKRVQKAKQVLNRSDCAVLVVDGTAGETETDRALLALFEKKGIPYLVAYNKSDRLEKREGKNGLWVSAKTGENIPALKERMAALVQTEDRRLTDGLLHPGDLALLAVPIDEAAPKGRLILPQQQVIRDALDVGAAALAVRPSELRETLDKLAVPPAVVITDSQAFSEVAAAAPEEIPLTSFSILMARYKGFLEGAVRGVAEIDRLQEGDRILVAEGCTHHRQCGDIGTVKIPRWLQEYTGKRLVFSACSGRDFPEDLSPYRLILHCGGCMLGGRELRYRRQCAADAGVAFANYGVVIAYLKGILRRSLSLFPELLSLLPEEK